MSAYLPDHLNSIDFGRSLDLLCYSFEQSSNYKDMPVKSLVLLHPIDFEIFPEFDIADPMVQQAIAESLPKVHVFSCALDCSTKSRIREIPRSRPRGHCAPWLIPVGFQACLVICMTEFGGIIFALCPFAGHAYSLQCMTKAGVPLGRIPGTVLIGPTLVKSFFFGILSTTV